MTSYQNEQIDTLRMVRRYLENLSAVELERLKNEAGDYLDLRREVQSFLSDHFSLKTTWNELQERRKRFTWPDKPILFDDLEKRFIDAGLKSTLMYLHNSPGLLRIKNQWQ